MHMDLETLRLLAWLMLGLLVIGLALFEGLNVAVCLQLAFMADNLPQQRLLIRQLAPTSVGNLSWLIITLTVLFAAWPIAYAVSMASLSWLVWPTILLISLRCVWLYFVDEPALAAWQPLAYKLLMLSGWLPACLLGILTGNLLKGVPFHLDSDMRILFLGDAGGLFNLFAWLVSATCVALLALYGATYLQHQPDPALQAHGKTLVLPAGIGFILAFALTGLWITHLEGYHISSEVLSQATSNPLAKFVKRGEGLWLDNYEHLPWLWSVPALAFSSALACLGLSYKDKAYWAMLSCVLCIGLTVITLGMSMFPFLLPSNLSLNSSLTIWDSSGSATTLSAVLGMAACALPSMFLLGRWAFCLQAQSTTESGLSNLTE